MIIFKSKPNPFPVLPSHNIICRLEDAAFYSTHQSLHILAPYFPDKFTPSMLSQNEREECISWKQWKYILIELQ